MISVKIYIICIVWPISQAYKPFGEVLELQGPRTLKKKRFCVLTTFRSIFRPFWYSGSLPKAPISEQIWIIYIAWLISQCYKSFREVSGLQ